MVGSCISEVGHEHRGMELGAKEEECGTDQKEVGMAKTIAEYRKGFEDLYNEMCNEHGIKASVSVFRETAMVCPIDELALTVVHIEID